MWVSLLAWVSHTHTEQEESWDDSSSPSLLTACQLEANGGNGSHRQAPSLTAEAATARGHIWKGMRDGCIPSYISCHSHLRNSRFHPVKESEEKTPCSCSISVNQTPALTAPESEGGLHQLSAPWSVRNNSSQNQRLLSFTNLAASFVGTRRHTTYQQTQTRMVFLLFKKNYFRHQRTAVPGTCSRCK